MKVKLLTPRAGPDVSNQAGDIIEVSKKEAKALFENDLAEPVRETRAATRKKAVKGGLET